MILLKRLIKGFTFSLLFSLTALSSFAETFYWESPKALTSSANDSRFAQTIVSRSGPGGVFFEEIVKSSSQIYISFTSTVDGLNFTSPKRIAGPFTYSDEIPEIYSACATQSGIWAVACLSSVNDMSIYTSGDYGQNWTSFTFPEYEYPLIAPRLYESSSGSLVLFACLARNEDFSILFSVSADGVTWTDFTEFTPPSKTPNASSAFAPYLIKSGSQDMVVYQQRYAQGDLLSFQIFSTCSNDNLKSWSTPVLVTGQSSLLDDDSSANYYQFNCQRPFLTVFNSGIYLAYERRSFTATTSDIICLQLNSSGNVKGIPVKLNEEGNASRPSLFSYKNSLYALWFDSQHGNENAYLIQKTGSFWDSPVKLSSSNASFAQSIITGGKNLAFIWQESRDNKTGIMALVKDHTVKAPVLKSLSFEEGKRSNQNLAKIEIQASEDSSGVQGFSWIWTRDKSKEPDKKLKNISTESIFDNNADKDGEWYLKARQLDYAGNWSDSSTMTFYRDTTPPLLPEILPPETDEYGMLTSNSFKIDWKADEKDDDIAGYTWSLEYMDSIPSRLSQNPYHKMRLNQESALSIIEEIKSRENENLEAASEPPRYIKSASDKNFENFLNKRNGIYVFSVAAVDTVGNIGPAAKKLIILNKYIPSTYVTTVNYSLDDYGNLSMEIIGGGFSYEGSVSGIYLDKDGQAPYDYVLTSSEGGYEISSDSRICNINIEQIEAADYYIGLVHDSRGLYFTKDKPISIKEYGTVKSRKGFDLSSTWQTIQSLYKINTNISTIILIALILFFVIAIIGSIAGLISSAKEAAVVKAEVAALVQGGIMPNERKSKITTLKRRGISLRIKLMFNSTLLVMIISALLIFTFRYILTTNGEETLSKGLYDRTNIILDSIETGTQVYLPLSTTGDNLSLQDTANQVSALNEAEYATIAGYSEEGNSTSMDYVWATTDNQIESKIDSDSYIYGVSRLTDEQYKSIIDESMILNQKASEKLGDIPTQLSEVIREASSLLNKNDQESAERRIELDQIRKQLNERITSILSEISEEGSGSIPEYNPETIDYDNTEYLFYKPVLYRRGSEQTYVHGMIFIKVSTKTLIEELSHTKTTIRNTSITMILLALLAAFVSSTLASTIIVSPLNKLVKHVGKIRDTEDKSKLEGKDLKIRARDEIGMLSETVNDMTHGLVDAAKASKNLTLGKEIQTKFIPLQTDDKGNTLTTGSLKTNGAEFFSYYAGADELSGDYFDYKQIDRDHFAIIKCDVSGHGVPAALIMVEVATLFLSYFNHWDMKNPRQGTNLSPVVGQINDLLESRGFKGRFAAFTLGILDTKTGEIYFCNAGDNQVHVFDSASRKKRIITLQETPAAGMFSTDLVDMKGGYKVSRMTLKKDDVLFLYTDGIEEAKRIIRKPNGEIIKSDGNNRDEEKNEEFSPERVSEIIEAVFERRIYTLKKNQEGENALEFTFDFTRAEANAENAIMALVSIEKIFRIYKPFKPNGNEKIKVDKKIDEFLRQYFKNYGEWCSERSEVEDDPTQLYYIGLCEDPQYDDLTLVSVKKN